MTDQERKAMEIALEALESGWNPDKERAITALHQALAQGEQEPFEYWSVADGWVTIEPEELIDGRATRKMLLDAMKQTDPQYRDDPECMFAMGWKAGFYARTRAAAPPSKHKEQAPDCGIDRGAWDGVEDVTQWLEELRGNEED